MESCIWDVSRLIHHVHWGWLAVEQHCLMEPGSPDRQAQRESATHCYGSGNHLHTCIGRACASSFPLGTCETSAEKLWPVSVSPVQRNTWMCWRMSQRCLEQKNRRGKRTGFFNPKNKRAKRLNCCLQALMRVFTVEMGIDLAVPSDRGTWYAAGIVKPSG